MFWDVDRRLDRELVKYQEAAQGCKTEYAYNHCSQDYSLPASVYDKCQELYICMNFRPEDHNLYSKMTTGLIAEILNDFFETISYDTILKFLVIIVICMAIEIPYAQFTRLRMKGVI
jgi:hypothetical protein